MIHLLLVLDRRNMQSPISIPVYAEAVLGKFTLPFSVAPGKLKDYVNEDIISKAFRCFHIQILPDFCHVLLYS